MIDIDNQTDLSIPLDMIQKIADHLTDKDIELLVIDNAEIQNINNTHRGIDKPTDVLSFPFDTVPMAPLGSIVISADFVQTVSKELKHTQDEEFCLLFIHGLLHLMGYDHEIDKGEMREKEEKIINTFKLPKSLILRSQE